MAAYDEHSWRPPSLQRDSIHIWLASGERPHWGHQHLWALLSVDERLRAEQLRGNTVRASYVVARGTLRLLLASYVLTEGRAASQQESNVALLAAGLRFSYSEHGKPLLEEAPNLQFSLAHSQGQLIYAFGHARPVGVDLEQISTDLNDLPFHSFAPAEQHQLNILSGEERGAQFFRYWVRKEAFLKATGEGLTRPLNSFEIELTPEGPGGLLPVRRYDGVREPWMVADLDLLPGYAAAVAAASDDWHISLQRLA
jgi:4'-phosphopantetheinyl transferase